MICETFPRISVSYKKYLISSHTHCGAMHPRNDLIKMIPPIHPTRAPHCTAQFDTMTRCLKCPQILEQKNVTGGTVTHAYDTFLCVHIAQWGHSCLSVIGKSYEIKKDANLKCHLKAFLITNNELGRASNWPDWCQFSPPKKFGNFLYKFSWQNPIQKLQGG